MADDKLLEWYEEIGVDEIIEDNPTAPMKPQKKVEPLPESNVVMDKHFVASGKKSNNMGMGVNIIKARELASSCNTLEQLREAVENFDGDVGTIEIVVGRL